MKAQKIYGGENSCGVSVEVSQSVSGDWYCREYGNNGYGNSWSKWVEYTGDLSFPTSLPYLNDIAPVGSMYTVEEGSVLDYGLSNLKLIPEPYLVRLPKDKK